MTDYGDISRTRPIGRTRASFGITPDVWPAVGRARAGTKTHRSGPQLDTAGVASVVVVPVPVGERVLLLDETHLRRIALADGSGATFLGVDPGSYIALREGTGQTWRVVIAGNGSSTVTPLGSVPPGTVYLENNRLKAAGTVPPGARLVALAPA